MTTRSTLIGLATAIALTACTPQQIHHLQHLTPAVRAQSEPTLAVADPIAPPATSTISATCTSVDITTAGLPDGSAIYLGIGSEPPYGVIVGRPDPWGRFQPSSTGETGHFIPGDYWTTHLPFSAILDITLPTGEKIRNQVDVATCDTP